MDRPEVVDVHQNLRREVSSHSGQSNHPEQTYHVYKKRWLLLLLLCLLQITNAINWICFAPKSGLVANYFNVDESSIDLLSLIYMIVFPVAIPINYAMQKWGLRFAMLGGSIVNAAGVCIRLLYFAVPSDYAFAVVLTGQGIAALTQPAFMLSATVLAATWFSDSERTAANSIASMSNLLGILLANGLTLFLLQSSSDTATMLYAFSLPAIVPMVLAMVLLSMPGSDIPARPPSPSAALFLPKKLAKSDSAPSAITHSTSDIIEAHTSPAHSQSADSGAMQNETVPFHKGAKAAYRTKSFWFLSWSIGVGFGVFNSLLTVNAQVFCARGYPNWLAAVVACTMIGSGFIGAVIVGWLIDSSNKASLEAISSNQPKKKSFNVRIDEVYTVLLALTSLAFIPFSVLSLYPDQEVAILLLSATFGGLAFPLFPLALELGVECTFPHVSEATSSTFLILGGQIHGIIYVLLGTSVLSSPLGSEQAVISTCEATSEPLNFMPFMVFMYSIVAVTCVIFTFFFKTELKRTEYDRRNRLGDGQGFDPNQPSASTS